MTLYDETVRRISGLAQRARTTEDVLFCERRPLTSLEAGLAGREQLALDLRGTEDEALRALARLVEAERGYESALRAVEEAGPDAAEWLRAVMLGRALETLGPS
jgi:hypothetical protein